MRTYAILHVSKQTYDEIAQRLRANGYDHAFMENDKIDLHGIAIRIDVATTLDENLQRTIYTFLKAKYVSRADDRQRAKGLEYTEAETHDLAKTLAKLFRKLNMSANTGDINNDD